MRSISQKIQGEQFDPGFLGIFVNPFFIARQALARALQQFAPSLSGHLLDVGCGNKPYRHFFTKVSAYTGIEFDSPHARAHSEADVFYDGTRFPFPDGNFNSVLATEVLEHVFNPDEWLEEIRRVLKPGGNLLLTAPFVWDEHEQPHDYARYSSFGISHLLKKHGFKITQQMKTADDVRVFFQLWNCYVYKKIPTKRYRLRILFYLVLIAPSTLLGLALYRLIPKSDDFYLGNVILAQKS